MIKKILGYTILAGLAASYLAALAYIIDFLQGLAIIGGTVLFAGLLILGIWLVN